MAHNRERRVIIVMITIGGSILLFPFYSAIISPTEHQSETGDVTDLIEISLEASLEEVF